MTLWSAERFCDVNKIRFRVLLEARDAEDASVGRRGRAAASAGASCGNTHCTLAENRGRLIIKLIASEPHKS